MFYAPYTINQCNSRVHRKSLSLTQGQIGILTVTSYMLHDIICQPWVTTCIDCDPSLTRIHYHGGTLFLELTSFQHIHNSITKQSIDSRQFRNNKHAVNPNRHIDDYLPLKIFLTFGYLTCMKHTRQDFIYFSGEVPVQSLDFSVELQSNVTWGLIH